MVSKYDDCSKLIVNLFSIRSLPVCSGHRRMHISSIKGNMVVYASMKHTENSHQLFFIIHYVHICIQKLMEFLLQWNNVEWTVRGCCYGLGVWYDELIL